MTKVEAASLPYQRHHRFDDGLKAILWVSATASMLLGWIFSIAAWFDTAVPLWLYRLGITVTVDNSKLEVSLWPLARSTVRRDSIRPVEKVTIDPLREYGGWGVKGKAKDRLFGVSGIEAVRVAHGDGESQKLTKLTDDTEGLMRALD